MADTGRGRGGFGRGRGGDRGRGRRGPRRGPKRDDEKEWYARSFTRKSATIVILCNVIGNP